MSCRASSSGWKSMNLDRGARSIRARWLSENESRRKERERGSIGLGMSSTIASIFTSSPATSRCSCAMSLVAGLGRD